MQGIASSCRNCISQAEYFVVNLHFCESVRRLDYSPRRVHCFPQFPELGELEVVMLKVENRITRKLPRRIVQSLLGKQREHGDCSIMSSMEFPWLKLAGGLSLVLAVNQNTEFKN